MATLQAGDIGDVVVGILENLGRLKWTDLSTGLQDHPFAKNLLKKEKVLQAGGRGMQWNAMMDHNSAARSVGLGSVDVVNQQDVMQTAESPFRHITTNWSIEERIIAMDRGDHEKILDLVQVARASGMVSLIQHLEERGWQKPTDSTDATNIFGIPYWITNASATTTVALNGGNPSGFTAGAGGLSSTTYPRWANWNVLYTAVTKDDLIRKMRELQVKSLFHSPVEMPTYASTTRRGIYTSYSIIGSMEELLEAQNDNLGNDLASKDGQCLFRRLPVNYVPYLDDNDAADSVYGIDWNTLRPFVLKGEFMKETGPKIAPRQHRTLEWFVDMSMNTLCYSRRSNWVASIS